MPLLKRPSAWLPIAMSALALVVVLGHIGIYGAARETEEGTAAHIWQLMMTIQIPIVAYFAIRWLPDDSKQAVRVLMLQVGAALAALAPVYLLGL